MTTVVHLTASRFVGGPEHQMLGLGRHLSGQYRSAFLSFPEGGLSKTFIQRAREEGFEARSLLNDTPYLGRATRELRRVLHDLEVDLIVTHGYKSDLLGLIAARRLGLPIVAVSHGWTRESARVRVYEAIGRICLRWMDRVVCVSEGQADKVRRAGVSGSRVVVIRDAIDTSRFSDPDALYADQLRNLFPGAISPSLVVGAAGRLSPEKGFPDLIAAARLVTQANPSIGFVLFGDGRLREELERLVSQSGLQGSFILAGFRSDLDRFLPHLDLFVQSSYTEGLPNVILEAFAAGVPVVATAVGGTPEVVEDGINGYLVQPGAPAVLAERTLHALSENVGRQAMGMRGRLRVNEEFSFDRQASKYVRLFESVAQSGSPVAIRSSR